MKVIKVKKQDAISPSNAVRELQTSLKNANTAFDGLVKIYAHFEDILADENFTKMASKIGVQLMFLSGLGQNIAQYCKSMRQEIEKRK